MKLPKIIIITIEREHRKYYTKCGLVYTFDFFLIYKGRKNLDGWGNKGNPNLSMMRINPKNS